MFIEIKTRENKTILLNKNHIVSVEFEVEPVVHGMPGGGQQLRLFALEGRVYQLDTRKISLEVLRDQLEPKELDNGQDQDSPVGK